jgi:NAD(P)-dependent dehydrogenase (short-subunit alcohol dehydrogenase family)
MLPSYTPQENVPTGDANAALAGRTALVTGASRGIGRAVALRLAQLGARVLLVARDQRALEAVKQHILQLGQLGGAADTIPCDLTSASAIAALGSRVEALGGCDILVNAAGIGRMGAPLHEMPIEDFDAIVATNLRAPFLLMRAVVPHMMARGDGHIVNISSLAGQAPLANGAAYAASKWALNGLSYSAAEELRAHNIRVSVVAPGSVNTGFGGDQSAIGSGAGTAEEIEKKVLRGRKKLQPEDVANVVAMLVTQPPQSFISEVRMRPTQKP